MIRSRDDLMHPLTAAMPAALAPLLRAGPLSPGKVEIAWKTSVGPALHRATSVKLEAGVLVVEAASASWASEIARSSTIIVSRLQLLLGPGAVTRLEVRR